MSDSFRRFVIAGDLQDLDSASANFRRLDRLLIYLEAAELTMKLLRYGVDFDTTRRITFSLPIESFLAPAHCNAVVPLFNLESAKALNRTTVNIEKTRFCAMN